ncbi:unnamed protein product [Caenorhabditis auriculariae]|uniref:Uncharacterized protein n=1 Tax=Caenorhabditis auriculariae TaxID=2777116 RepID=A0A8S1HJ84_9PELO|nr:unnamed protein product [Caenorhabditis auriculariae]
MSDHQGVRRRKSRPSDDDSIDSDDSEYKDIVDDIQKDRVVDEIPNDTRWSQIKTESKRWGETSSIHGFPHVAQANAGSTIAFWLFILLLSTAGLVYLFTVTLKQYFSYAKTVNIKVGLQEFPFPSITLCNINPYKLSAIQGIPELEALLSIYESAGDGTF